MTHKGISHMSDAEYIEHLEVRVQEQVATILRLTCTLQSINRMLSPGNRTMDELMRDMGYACDSARAALSTQEKP